MYLFYKTREVLSAGRDQGTVVESSAGNTCQHPTRALCLKTFEGHWEQLISICLKSMCLNSTLDILRVSSSSPLSKTKKVLVSK